jgi:FMN-dependent NADH-azoreductase
MKLLHIDSSALGAHSVTRELTAAIVDAWKRREPGLEITYRDLGANPLPHWLPVAEAASMPAGDPLAELFAADVIVIGAPMYNFGIPSQLKAWIDRIVIAGKTFQYGASGPEGLAGGRKVIIASARGGFYGADTGREGADFQENYLRHVFNFIGITDVEFLRAEGIGMGPDQRTKSIGQAHAEIETRLPVAA